MPPAYFLNASRPPGRSLEEDACPYNLRHTFPLGKSGRFVNRPYGTHPRLALQKFHVATGNISRRRRRHFTKSSILFHVANGNISPRILCAFALQYFTLRSNISHTEGVFHKITDFISRCHRQHFTAAYHAASAAPFALCKPLFAFTPIMSQNLHNATVFLRAFCAGATSQDAKKERSPAPSERQTNALLYSA